MKMGFTLLEIVLVLAVISVLSVVAVPSYRGLQIRKDMDFALVSAVQALREAQVLAQAVEGDSTWGVKVASPNIILFKGVSYATRDTSYDEIYDLPSDVSVSGITEVVFSKVFGDTANTGSMSFLSTNGDSIFFNINSKGVIY